MEPVSVLVFVKDPGCRKVKSRLARDLGEGSAVEFYLANLRRLVEELGVPDERLRPVLLVDPPEAVASFPGEIGWSHPVRPQAAGDLGNRLRTAFQEAGGPAMAVGTDVPELGRATILEAATRMAAGKVVLGPSPDGGYYLIGLMEPRNELFQEIPWSTAEVLSTTVAWANRFALRVEWLDPLADVDEIEDLLELDLRLDRRGPLGEMVHALVTRYRHRAGSGESWR